jgi:hypothetical protein
LIIKYISIFVNDRDNPIINEIKRNIIRYSPTPRVDDMNRDSLSSMFFKSAIISSTIYTAIVIKIIKSNPFLRPFALIFSNKDKVENSNTTMEKITMIIAFKDGRVLLFLDTPTINM